MNDRHVADAWAVPVGTWLGTPVRVSVLFAALAVILGVRLGWAMGLSFTAVLMVSTLVHEFGHVWACRALGGLAEQITLWPLGGMAALELPRSTAGRMITLIAGPTTNALLCLVFLPTFYAPEQLTVVLNPFLLPALEFTAASWGRDLLLLSFVANWILLLVNLIPALPLDGGQVLLTVWQSHSGRAAAVRGCLLVAMTLGWTAIAVGLLASWPWVVAIGAVILILNLANWHAVDADDSSDELFLGYDFSQGYTSLERTARAGGMDPGLSWWQQWKARRQEDRAVREQQRLHELEEQLDSLLAKVHEQGLQALTPAEQRRLKEASEAFRHRPRKDS